MRTKAGIFFLFLLMASAQAWAGCRPENRIPGQFIVRLVTESVSPDLQSRLPVGSDFKYLHRRPRLQNSIMSLDRWSKIPAAVVALRADSVSERDLSGMPEVASVEPDCWVRRPLAVTASELPFQDHHTQIDTLGAWSLLHDDDDEIVVAVSDTGVDFRHEDLAPVMWVNKTELTGVTGLDDDGNGCVDDLYGCDLAEHDGDPTPSADPGSEHGTHVAGIIGASSENSLGGYGVAKHVRILAAKGFPDYGDAQLSDLLNSVYYSIRTGARVINCSWGSSGAPTAAEREAFDYAVLSGVVPVVAAGNDYVNVSTASPASLPSVLTVGSVGSQDTLSTFSNFGLGLDLVAPGGDRLRQEAGINEVIYSTLPGNTYGGLRGTSMAAPMVSAVAAMILSVNSVLEAADVADILARSGDLVSAATPEGSFAVSRLNARAAIRLARGFSPLGGPDPANVEPCRAGEECGLGKKAPAGNSSSSTGCGLKLNSGMSKSAGASQALLLLLPLSVFFGFRRRY